MFMLGCILPSGLKKRMDAWEGPRLSIRQSYFSVFFKEFQSIKNLNESSLKRINVELHNHGGGEAFVVCVFVCACISMCLRGC